MEVYSVSKSIVQNYSFAFSSSAAIDSEEKEIIARLLAYGVTPTGDKQTDKNLLHKIELEKARQEVNSNPEGGVSSNKYLTVSQGEINAMTETKKERKQQTKTTQEHNKGAEILASYNQFLINKKKIEN